MDDVIDVFSIGVAVMLDGEIPATITSINLRGLERRVSYECTWWDGRCRKAEWFESFEITAQDAKRVRLRFAPKAS